MRLTLGFAAFFSILMLAAGFFFRDSLEAVLRQHAVEHLMESWNSVRMHLEVGEGGHVSWSYDHSDPEEAFGIEQMRKILLLADSDGRVLEITNGYRALGVEMPETIHKALSSHKPIVVERWDSRGGLYHVRMGKLRQDGKDYFLAMGTPVTAADEVLGRNVRVYFLLVPLMLFAVSAIGWFLAGRALKPLNDVAEASQYVSADNLKLRIQAPGTDDELDRLVRRFNEMMDRLEHNFEQMRQFTINASHELRTPVTGLRGQLEVALLHARTTDEYREAVETAMDDVERLSLIVKSLLFLSQADSGKISLHKHLHDLSPLVNELVEEYKLRAAEKGTTVTSLAPESCMALVDRAQVERLLSTLLSNAVTHTPAGGHVRVTLTKENGRLHLAVSDNGPGIAPVHLPHIFDRFYRIRDGEREEQKGLGLGLSLALWIAKAHEGDIEVKSTPGQGSVFIANLPAGVPDGALPVLVGTSRQGQTSKVL